MIEFVVIVGVLVLVAGFVRRFWAQIIAFVVLSGVFAIAAAVYLVMQGMQTMMR